MVKTLPTVERSTKIRFGKNAQQDQGENTIVLNASNTAVDASLGGAVYISPVRFEPGYDQDNDIVLMMYNRSTKEMVESGEPASTLISDVTLEGVTLQGNVTSHSMIFYNNAVAFVTSGNVGIANSLASHTLSVGSNLYVDDTGSNILVVAGGVSIDGNLTVNGGVTTISTENLTIEDAIIELGKNNTSEDTGLIMTRPGSNVTVGFREVENEFVLAYTQSSAESNMITPITSEDLDVHVYGGVLTESNVGVKTTSPDAELHVVGNVYVSSNLTVDTDTFHVDVESDHVGINTKNPNAELHVVGNVYVSSNLTVNEDTLHVDVGGKSIGLGTVNPKANLHVVGNVYVSSNLTVDTDTFHVDVEADHVGINTKNPNADLHVIGNVYVSSNLTVDEDTLHVDAGGKSIGLGTVNPKANLHVVGNVYVSSNLTVDEDTFHVDSTTNSVGIETKNPSANLHVVGNVYVSSNLTVDEDTFHVDAGGKSIGLGTVNPTSNLHVVGNAYVSSNLTTDGTLNLKHPTTALITDLTANVEVKLDQLNSVSIDGPLAEHTLIYDGSDWINEYPMHTYIKIRNDLSGVNIEAGDAVYVKGTHNTNILNVGLAKSDDPSTMPCIGLSNQLLTPGQEGTAVAYGKALSVVTEDFLPGETVFVSNTVPGGLSNVKPYNNDLIQNVGVVTNIHQSNGGVFVTGIGRANDIPNAPIVADETDINYVYVNNENNDLKKILPTNLLTQLQTLQQVTDTGNTTSNTIQFTNATTGLVTTSNLHVGSNISVTGLANPINKHLPMVGTDGFFEQSPVYVTPGGKYVISSAEAEFLGNITLSGNNTVVSSTSVTIEDRIFGIGANNEVHNLDTGLMMEHKDDGEYANIALIYHADEHRFSISYTQNTFTDDHILHYEDADHQMLIDFIGNVEVQHNLVVNETTTITDDLTVGTNDLFVDVATSRVGVGTDAPGFTLDVHGTSNVGAFSADSVSVSDTTSTTSKTSGAVQIAGGLGISGNVHGLNANFEDVVANSVIINDTTFSDSRTTGALVVAGGVGIADDLYAYRGVFSQDLTVDTNTLKVLGFENRVGINTVAPQASLHVVGNAYVSSNLTVDTDTLHVDATNKRVGIETSSPEANLHVTGNVYVSSNLEVGASALYVDTVSATSNVGIGTSAPEYSLDVVGDINFSGDFYQGGSLFVSTPWTITPAGSGEDLSFTSGNVSVGTTIFHVDSIENKVGIGTIQPAYDLDVVGDINFSGAFYQGGLPFVSTPWTIETGPDALSYTDGNVGIGVENPDANLHVSGNVYATNVECSNLIFDTVLVTPSAGLNNIVNVSNTTSNTVQFTNNDTSIITYGKVGILKIIPDATLDVFGNAYISSNLTVDTNTFHVDSTSNRVGIGKIDPAYTLDVVGNAYISSNLTVDTLDVVVNAYISSNLTVDSNTFHVDSVANRVGIGKIDPAYTLDVNGTIYASGDLIAFSDERKKTNIEPIPNALEKVLQLRGVTFDKIDGDDRRHAGVIAQEVEKVLPEVVYTDIDGMKGVAYGNVIGLLIEAIKELARNKE